MAIEFLFDYASPYSFLANETLGAKLPGAEIAYRPVYLRGFDAFSKGIPYTAPRLAYMINDLRRCADDAGVLVSFPTTFPINGLYALRGALAAQRAGTFTNYHDAMFRAVWQKKRDISRKESVAALATELGFPDIAAALDDEDVKTELRANTDDAIRRGAFGVPTFFVGAELYWGHDRMYQVAKAAGLASWESSRDG
jgi:2-hydroxychromene-2-carboxylate isomerase